MSVAEEADGAVVVDLTRLRPLLATKATGARSSTLKSLALRYDAAVLLPRFTASKALIPLPGR